MAGGNGTGFGGKSMRDIDDEGDFEEADVWGNVVVKEREDSIPRVRKYRSKEYHFSSSGSSSSAWLFPAAPRVIPRAKSEPKIKMSQQHSAPVNIPDWSKIYKNKNIIGGDINVADHDDDHHVYNVGGAHKKFFDDHDGDVEGEDEDGDEDEMVPPHEFIARRLARTQICSYSMCEGIGRTLKGRDLSKLRNAILAKTGFLE